MRATVLASAVLVLATSGFGQQHPISRCQAEVFVPESLIKKPVITSPDGTLKLVLSARAPELDEDIRTAVGSVWRGKHLIGRLRLKNLSAGIFVKWAPDSKAFYIMWSSGGMIGDYHVRVFRAEGDDVRELTTTKLAVAQFIQKHNCVDRGINVSVVRWIGDSNHILLSTQVYPTSDCGRQAGVTRGYLVRTDDGAILKELTEKEIRLSMQGCPSNLWPTAFWGTDELAEAKAAIEKQKGRK